MSAVIGIILCVLAVLIFGVALVVARKPNAPGWLIEGFGGSLVTITSIAFLVTGLGLVGQFVASYGREPLDTKETVFISISVILLIGVFVSVVKALRRSTPMPDAPSTPMEPAFAATVKEEELTTPPRHDPSRPESRKRFGSKRAA